MMHESVFPLHHVQKDHKHGDLSGRRQVFPPTDVSESSTTGAVVTCFSNLGVSSGDLSKGDVEPARSLRKGVAVSPPQARCRVWYFRRRSCESLSQPGHPAAWPRSLDEDSLWARDSPPLPAMETVPPLVRQVREPQTAVLPEDVP